jgi:hypothetical protein
MDDVQAILLTKAYQETLFSDLYCARKKENGGRETLVTCPSAKRSGTSPTTATSLYGADGIAVKPETGSQYLKKTKGLDFKDALLHLAQAAGLNVVRDDQAQHHDYACKADILETAQSFFIEILKQDIGAPVKVYLLRRGYSETDIDAMEVGAPQERE